MHLCMASRLRDKFHLDNQFMLGQVLPDLMVAKGNTSTQTHYLREYVVDGFLKRLPDMERFERENGEALMKQDPITLGYYAHLLQDKIWYQDFISQYAKYMPVDRNLVFDLWQEKPIPLSEFNKRIYHDYAHVDRYQLENLGYSVEQFKQELTVVPQAQEYLLTIEQKIVNLPYENTANFYISDYDSDRYIKRAYKVSIKALRKYL